MKELHLAFLIFALTSLLGVGSCTQKITSQQEDCLIVEEASSQSHTPGVYSNLRGNTEYRIVLSKPCASELEITQVIVKDIVLNVKSIQVDGKYINDDFSVKGSCDSLIVFANQYEYNEDGPQVHAVEVYEKSGLNMGGKLSIRYKFQGNTKETAAVEVNVLEPVLHN